MDDYDDVVGDKQWVCQDPLSHLYARTSQRRAKTKTLVREATTTHPSAMSFSEGNL